MANLTCYGSDGLPLERLTQWDMGQELVVKGADTSIAPMVHFCNRRSEVALPVQSTISGNSITAKIPNILLQTGLPVIAHMYYHESSTQAKTLYSIVIPVDPRPMPSDYEYKENIDYISWVELEAEALAFMDKLEKDSNAIIAQLKIDSDATLADVKADSEALISQFENETTTFMTEVRTDADTFMDELTKESDTLMDQMNATNAESEEILERLELTDFRATNQYIQVTTDGVHWKNLVAVDDLVGNGIADVIVEYCQREIVELENNLGVNIESASSVQIDAELSTSEWSDNIPAWRNGYYVWKRMVITYTDERQVITSAVCITGPKGDTGNGILSIFTKYAVSSNNETAPTTWYDEAPTMGVSHQYLWCYDIVTYTSGDVVETEPRVVGAHGNTGATGNGIASVTEQYYHSTSATSLSGGSWGTTAPSWVDKKYVWSRSIITYTNGDTVTTNAVCITGGKGDKGDKGDTGNGVEKIDSKYAVSSSKTTAPNSWSAVAPEMNSENQYLWCYDTITYTDGSVSETGKRVIGAHGDTGSTGNGISSVSQQYYQSTTSASLSGGSWSDSVPAWVNNRYLWIRTVVTYTNGTSVTSDAVCVTGAKGNTGDKGDKGDTGVSVDTISAKYAVSASNTVIPTSWSNTAPTMTASNRYLWTYEIITFTDGSTSETAKHVVGAYGDAFTYDDFTAEQLANLHGADGTDGKDGENGATFTPSVSEDGFISWTNDKGLTNPPTVKIASGMTNITVTIPISAWKQNSTSTLYVYYADVNNSEVTSAHYPVGTPTIDSLAEAQYCGLAPVVQTLDGALRFYSETIPSSALTIDIALWEE